MVIKKDEFNDEIGDFIDSEFEKYANKFNIVCDYNSFIFTAKEDDKLIGIITGKAYYKEIHISDLIVTESGRGNHVGKQLVETVINYFDGKGFDNINLTTYNFQAPKFYEKLGFELEFVRECKENNLLNKNYMVRYY